MTGDLVYAISLPERALRAAAVFLGGSVYEATQALLPGWLRRTRLYQAIVAGLLRITIEVIGGASGILPQDEITAQQLAIRKAAGTSIEMLGILTIGWSPLWLFAVVSDLTGGARTYLNALVSELKREGLLLEDAEINSTEELLSTFEDTSGLVAEILDIPPLTIQGLRTSWGDLNKNVRDLPELGRLARIYAELTGVAQQEDCALGDLSSLLAASAIRAGINVGQIHIFDFYSVAIRDIEREGLQVYYRRLSRPYITAARNHLDPRRLTYTQRLLGHGRKNPDQPAL